ncbi:helicase C-terminal domain-containing protein [Pelagicoccus sp. SDUM812003]|uniref:ATP-dependent DNA helicase n=1 Tax=Pelagicoccus sp. SDUM812003 TaxID=3041267 RepID=UPI00280DB238|nr:helicase C-terminal domain-containing protein [Pelagicoccus sp. SDUM812003]MDQ8202365.1 helicase C-terminal domain-containing protein [Pelagicoccus sp. SDUM812003]
MQIDAEHRLVTLSVGEFSSFTPYAKPGFGGASAIWRAQVGTIWHQRIQSDSAQAGEDMQDEVPISGALSWRSWEIRLSGRIDQLKREQRGDDSLTHLREIKSLSQPLPLQRDELLERYPHYPIQLLAYRELMIRDQAAPSDPSQPSPLPTTPRYHLELLLVEIGSGLTQSLTLDASYDGLLVDQLDAFVDYLESQQERLARLRSLLVRSAYPSPRPGQETIQRDLAHAFEHGKIALLQAPTGYGKTGVAWEYATRRLASGQSDRVLYLTSKTTGQTEAVARLKALLEPSSQSQLSTLQARTSPSASFWHIRNKQEHCINTEFRCSRATCPYLNDLHEKWKRSGLQRLYLLSYDEADLETVRAEGRATGICPYEIMRAGLGFRDIWIGDYAYLFSPQSARLLDEQNDFDPARTFLIIDEAHNLPSRVEGSFTYQFDVQMVYAAADDLHHLHASRRIQNLLKSLSQIIVELPCPADRRAASSRPSPTSLEPSAFQIDDFYDHLSQISQTLINEPLPYDDLQAETNDLLFLLSAAQASRQRGELRHQLWSPAAGAARLECIDSSRYIASQLSRYDGVLALSATFGPLDSYLSEIGLSDHRVLTDLQTPNTKEAEPIFHLNPPAPWRNDAYDIAIDLRVDTRYKQRGSHLETTADTIAKAAQAASPVVVFFPSYAYAKQALDALQVKHPFVRSELQPRAAGTLAERNAYLEQAIAFNDALFLILGSSYAEGIDSLGGKAGCAIVVSPALPEMNYLQETKRQHYESQGRNGFERAYLEPGIQKVNQALGRLVRAPEHKVKAILHCQRFAEPKTRSLLDPLYQSRAYLHTDADLENWLESKSSGGPEG